jgi:hypothetical protein
VICGVSSRTVQGVRTGYTTRYIVFFFCWYCRVKTLITFVMGSVILMHTTSIVLCLIDRAKLTPLSFQLFFKLHDSKLIFHRLAMFLSDFPEVVCFNTIKSSVLCSCSRNVTDMLTSNVSHRVIFYTISGKYTKIFGHFDLSRFDVVLKLFNSEFRLNVRKSEVFRATIKRYYKSGVIH